MRCPFRLRARRLAQIDPGGADRVAPFARGLRGEADARDGRCGVDGARDGAIIGLARRAEQIRGEDLKVSSSGTIASRRPTARA